MHCRWAIRYLIIDTVNWWIAHKVLISPEWLSKVNWVGSSITVNLTRETV